MLANNYGGEITDKIHQGYLPVYLKIAAELGPAARVLELGVYEGHSLALWMALFPHGEITGVDIDLAPFPAGWLFPHCQVIQADASSPDLPAVLGGGPFDLIVDDASHLGEETALSFKNLWPLVAPGGVYCIEDWWVSLSPSNQFGQDDKGSMLEAVTGPLRLLSSPDSECDEITYRYGLCIIRKRRP